MAAGPRGRRERHQAIREIVARTPVASQRDLVAALLRQGWNVTAATVSRDVAALGLVRVPRAGGHRLLLPEDLARTPSASEDRLRRLLADIPVTVRRSGLILLLVSAPGTANTIAHAIDSAGFDEQEGTLAGDDTTLVLFADDARLERWLMRFRSLQGFPVRDERPVA